MKKVYFLQLIESIKHFKIKLESHFIGKDKIFYKFYLELDNKNIFYEQDEGTKTRILFYTPFVEQRKDIDCFSALYSIKMPFELVHADIADNRFFSKSTVDPKYCLLAVDLFTSKVYVYIIKGKNLLSKKSELDIQQKREQSAENTTMRLQTDLELAQNEILKNLEKIMLKCLVVESGVVKLMLLSRKLKNLKNFFLKVNMYIKQPRTNILIQEN